MVSRDDLGERRLRLRKELGRKSMLLGRSDCRAKAQVLAVITRERGMDMAILHSDLDYSRSEVRGNKKGRVNGMREKLRKEICEAFASMDSQFIGVALIPVPRTEAWLIRMAGSSLSPEEIEDLPGNDHAKRNGAKAILKELGYTHADGKSDLVIERYCPETMNLPSHTAFLDDFNEACRSMVFSVDTVD